MANDADGHSWDIASPADDSLADLLGVEGRGLRAGIGARMAKEHVAPAAADVGGEHLSGSAIVYVVPALPTTRPDGITLLDINDIGRVCIVSTTGQVLFWNGN